MALTVWAFLIVCPLVFVAGFVDSVAGGGGVISLPAYLIAGIPMKLAAGTNKLANGCGTAISAYRYARSGKVVWLAAVLDDRRPDRYQKTRRLSRKMNLRKTIDRTWL
ncbi:MAG: TSUP family transporter [Clostridia bacterium]|nr:TSUP family transporter [Clostridia bacterium]